MAGTKKTRAALLERDAGKGHSPDIADRMFWLDDDRPLRDAWFNALGAIDRRGDAEPLVALLRSEYARTHDARFYYLADLIDRHTLTKKPGKTATPLTPIAAKTRFCSSASNA